MAIDPILHGAGANGFFTPHILQWCKDERVMKQDKKNKRKKHKWGSTVTDLATCGLS